MLAGIDQDQRSAASLAPAPAAMLGGAPATHRGDPGHLPQMPHRLTRDREFLELAQFLGEMAVVQSRVLVIDQFHDPLPIGVRESIRSATPSVPMKEPLNPGAAIGVSHPESLIMAWHASASLR